MITIYHLSTSRSERIVWLMEEFGLEYTLEPFQREPNVAAPDALKEIHPLGKAPVISDGDTVLAESGAIVDYIVHRYGADRLAVQATAPNTPLSLLVPFCRGQPNDVCWSPWPSRASREGAQVRRGRACKPG